MSSPSPRRSSRWAAAVVVGAACWLTTAIPATALPTAGVAGDPVVTVQSAGSDADPLVRLVADTGTRDPQAIRARDLSVILADGNNSDRPVPSQAVPLLSGRSDVMAVLDTTSAAAPGLPEVRSGMTDLLLQLPPAARSGAVVTGERPQVLASLESGATGALGRLSEVEASGSASNAGGSTAEALGLALQALGDVGSVPADGTSSVRPRVVVLQTAAGDAGGESAADLGERLRRAGVVLEVVTGPGGSAYWQSVADATGGGVAQARSGQAEAAFSRVSDALRHTFLVTFARPAGAVDGVSVRFGGAAGGAGAFVDLTTSGSSATAAESDADPAAAGGSGPSLGAVVNVIALLLLALAGGVVLHGLRRRPRGAHEAGVPIRPVPVPPFPSSAWPAPPAAKAPTRDEPMAVKPKRSAPAHRRSSNGVPDAAPAVTSAAVPQLTPQVPSQAAPQAAPQPAPQAAPQPAPEPAPEPAPLVVPQARPEPAAENAPQPAPESTPQPVPQARTEPAAEPGPQGPGDVPLEILPESAAVAEARRRARATGAAVAAAARAAAAVRTPSARPRPGPAPRPASAESDRPGSATGGHAPDDPEGAAT
jgi:hypothetical protein